MKRKNKNKKKRKKKKEEKTEINQFALKIGEKYSDAQLWRTKYPRYID